MAHNFDLDSILSFVEAIEAKEMQSDYILKGYRVEIKITKIGGDGCEECAFEENDSPYCKDCSRAHIDYWRPKE